MAQKTVYVEVSAIYSFTYDPESTEFKEALNSYAQVIERGGNEESLIAHVAHNLRRSGTAENMVEGVGYIQKEGDDQPLEVFSGITVEDDDPDFNYEIL